MLDANSNPDDTASYAGFVPTWAADPSTGYTIPQTIGLPSANAPMLPADYQDASQMQPFAPAGDATPWFQQMAMFGFSRAIDNLSRTNVAGNVDPGSFAGTNGGTYSQVPQGQGGGAQRTATGSVSASARLTGSPMLLLVGLVVAVLILK